MAKAPTPFESMMRDQGVVEEISAEASSRRKFPNGDLLEEGNKTIAQYMEFPASPEERMESEARFAEAIILAQGRPSLLIRENTFEPPQMGVWKTRLEANQSRIEKVIPSVGRVEVVRHPDFEWLGTAWMIDENVLITNRHVAREFARKQGGQFSFVRSPMGGRMEAKVDFREEFRNLQMLEIHVDRVLWIADDRQADIAFLQIESSEDMPQPLELAESNADIDDPVGVIGYPAFDTRNSIRQIEEIFGDIFDVKRFAPGFVSFEDGPFVFRHDCTTLGGNSGSPVFSLETGQAVGLHFSGRFGVANFAVKISEVKNQLRRSLPSTSVACGFDVGSDERRMRPSDYEGREGYNERFLGRRTSLHVPLPQLTCGQLDDAVYIDGVTGRGLTRYTLDYTHFSVIMSKSRRLAFYTAVNIDGTKEMFMTRQNTTWVFDGRIPERFQAGNDIYRHNDADRGHLVRRLDPVWGTAEIAQQADTDTFHYTNAAPQHKNLNRQVWLSLEDHLLRNAARRDLKITVFTGPVLQDSDTVYRGLKIPEEFWKVVAMANEDGELHATAYLLSQRELVDDFEFVFGRFRTFQTSVHRIEEKTDLDFGDLRNFDPLTRFESVGGESSSFAIENVENILL